MFTEDKDSMRTKYDISFPRDRGKKELLRGPTLPENGDSAKGDRAPCKPMFDRILASTTEGTGPTSRHDMMCREESCKWRRSPCVAGQGRGDTDGTPVLLFMGHATDPI